jgi:DNA-binding transcriptional LysR family regulator
VTQPTLSAAIKQLEGAAGRACWSSAARASSGLTAEGEQVLAWARRIVGRHAGDEARRCARRVGACRAGCGSRRSRRRSPWWRSLTTPLREKPSGRLVLDPVAHLGRGAVACSAISTWTPASPIWTTSRSGASCRCRSIRERYQLITAAGNPLLGSLNRSPGRRCRPCPLCLLTPDMQNRRIIDQHLAQVGRVRARPTLESNSMIVLYRPHPHRQVVVDHAAQPGRDTSASPSRSAPSRSWSRMPAILSALSSSRANHIRHW